MPLLLLLVLTGAAPEGSGLSRFQVSVSAGVLAPVGAIGVNFLPEHSGPSVSLEGSVFVTHWLRTSLLLGAAYLGEHHRQFYPGDHGIFRLRAAADIAFQVPWGVFFGGVSVGPSASNWVYDFAHYGDYPPDSYDSPFSWMLAAGARIGFEGLFLRWLVVGTTVGYGLTVDGSDSRGGYQFVEFDLRVGVRI